MLCPICEKHKTLNRDFVLFETEDLLVSHWPSTSEDDRVYKGYCFIEPKNHIIHMSQLSDSQAQFIGLWAKRLDGVFSRLLQSEKTYFFKFADITPHVHVHVYPRHPQTPQEIVGEGVRFWSEVPKVGQSEVAKLCKEIRKEIRGLL